MIWKKYILTKLFIVTGFVVAFATPQVPDILIYKGDTISVYMNLLPDEFYKFNTTNISDFEYISRTLNVSLFGNKKTCEPTSCGDGYRAMWKIIENQLYLIGIYSCCYYKDSIKADLTSLFKERVIDGKIKADWITGNFTSLQGKRLLYDHSMATVGVYEYELEFYFVKGKLTKTKLYDNSKSRQSIYSQDQEKLNEHIYSNINWNILPKQDTMVRVIVEFVANENGFIDEVKIVRGYNQVYDQEAIRVIKTIPEWDIYFSKGQFMRRPWFMPINFSKKNREKYGK
jgi:Gram-negative bacterial tonB protein.